MKSKIKEEAESVRRIMASPYRANPPMHDAFIEPSEMPWALRPDAFSMRKPSGINPSELVNVNLMLKTKSRVVSKETNRMGQRANIPDVGGARRPL